MEGCYLVPGGEACRRLGIAQPAYRSTRNGRGPRAWIHHWLVIPLHRADGSRLGFIWADEPEDRLLPSRPRLQALRLFANQATAAVVTARAVEELRFLADARPADPPRQPPGVHGASGGGGLPGLPLRAAVRARAARPRRLQGPQRPPRPCGRRRRARRGGRRPAARAAALGPRLPPGGRRVRAAAGPQRPRRGDADDRARARGAGRRWTSAASRRRARRSGSPWAGPGRSTPRRSCATPTTRSTPPSARSAPHASAAIRGAGRAGPQPCRVPGESPSPSCSAASEGRCGSCSSPVAADLALVPQPRQAGDLALALAAGGVVGGAGRR